MLRSCIGCQIHASVEFLYLCDSRAFVWANVENRARKFAIEAARHAVHEHFPPSFGIMPAYWECYDLRMWQCYCKPAVKAQACNRWSSCSKNCSQERFRKSAIIYVCTWGKIVPLFTYVREGRCKQCDLLDASPNSDILWERYHRLLLVFKVVAERLVLVDFGRTFVWTFVSYKSAFVSI